MTYDKKDEKWHKRKELFPMYGVFNFITMCGERGYMDETSEDPPTDKCEKCEAAP